MERIRIETPAFITQGNCLKAIGLFDCLSFETLGGRKIAIVSEGGYRIATNHANPVYIAAIALQSRVPGKAGVKIGVEKNIPPGKGLHSQMGNAVGTLLALNRMWKLRLSNQKLISIAQSVDPILGELLKSHFGASKKKGEQGWFLVAIPKTIQLNRTWLTATAAQGHKTPESVAIAHFPDLKRIMDTLDTIGWRKIQMAGMGPAISGYSERKNGIGKLPKKIREKLDFEWVGKACNGEFKLLH